jgi:hypothetical protein
VLRLRKQPGRTAVSRAVLRPTLAISADCPKSPRTVAAYLGGLRLFAAWFARTNGEEMNLQAITFLDVREYRQHLLTVRRHKPGTCHVR